ncbi:MAG: peptide chain release factor 1 [Clostridia bacterium]
MNENQRLKFKNMKARYEEIVEKLQDASVYSDMPSFLELKKEESTLIVAVTKFDEFCKLESALKETARMHELERDEGMKELISEEISELKLRLNNFSSDIVELLTKKDEDDLCRSIFIEIRAGAGGDEAALFASLVLRMYMRYAERRGFKFALIDESRTEMGGIKECIMNIKGAGVYKRLRYESGVHRVQRVPETESSGRIHTSTITVAVFAEADDVEFQISESDLRIDTFRSSGAGGQHVNKTESAIRITHIPTGTVVQCQDEKSQLKNKEQAMRVLKARLKEHYRREKADAVAKERRDQVGTGDRSERIRSYNFREGRVTDHRVNLTLYKLTAFLDGEMDEILDALCAPGRE